MVSISGNPENIKQVEQQEQKSSTQTSTPKHIFFKDGLTREEAYSASNTNIKSLFDKYNVDGDGVISRDEYLTYFSQTEKTSSSGTRIAIGGKYTVQSGDTLGKIASDFGVPISFVYEKNKDIIGNDANTIRIGMVLTIFAPRPEEHKCNHSHENGEQNSASGTDECKHHHLTKEEQQKILERWEKNPQIVKDIQKVMQEMGINSSATNWTELKAELAGLSNEQQEEIIHKTRINKINEAWKQNSAEALEDIQKVMQEMGINSSATNWKELKAELAGLSNEDQQKVLNNILKEDVDFSLIDESILEGGPENLLKYLNPPMTMEEFEKLDPADKGTKLAEAINIKKKRDLDINNPDSMLNQEIKAFDKASITEKEREEFKDINFDNLTQEDIEKISRRRVYKKYEATVIDDITKKIGNGDDINAVIEAQAFLRSFNKNQIVGIKLYTLMDAMTDVSDELRTDLSNVAAEELTINDEIDPSWVNLTSFITAQYASEEALTTFINNNQSCADIIQNAFEYLALNTTDTSRQEMLNNVIEYVNTLHSVLGENNDAIETNGTSGSYGGGSNSAVSNPISNQAPVSNPILPQFEYVNQLKQASQAFVENASRQEENSNSVIPEQFRNDFKSVSEYLEFKPTGLSVAKFREVKQALQQNFTVAIDNIIKNYSSVPDKYKGQIFKFFACMDNKTSCELYISGSPETRAFMKKYQYINANQLLSFAETNQAQLKTVDKDIKILINELKEKEEETV